jgi:hypothetical protein
MTTTQLKSVLSKEMDANMLVLLKLLSESEDLVPLLQEYPRITSSVLTLQRRGLITVIQNKYEVTLEGIQTLKQLLPKSGITKGKKEAVVIQETTPVAVFDVLRMHSALQQKLFSIIKKKQVTGFGNVLFIPSVKDLEEFLFRFKRKYGELWDPEKIEKILVKHVEECAKKDKYSPAVKYFIIKEGTGSQLAAALENFEEKPAEEEQHNLTNTKDLFG